MSKPHLICVVGPTAVGKTSVAISLAKTLGTEILSADSRQFYRELEIGTAKPSQKELHSVTHHFIDSLSIHDDYDVRQFEKEVIEKLNELYKKYKCVILVGGSGLFVNAVCHGLDDMPDIIDGTREKLNQELKESGIETLRNELRDKDPDYYEKVDINNPQRIVRALEVIRSTNQPFSKFRKNSVQERPFLVTKVGLEMDRDLLYERIDMRMDQMIAAGLFEEAERFFKYRHLNALQTVGYKEIFGFMEGQYDKEEAIRLLKRNSRRYAKRQLTWFKRDAHTRWFEPGALTEITDYIKSRLELSESEN